MTAPVLCPECRSTVVDGACTDRRCIPGLRAAAAALRTPAPEVSPETDLDLRGELDAARAEIDRLREKVAEWARRVEAIYRDHDGDADVMSSGIDGDLADLLVDLGPWTRTTER